MKKQITNKLERELADLTDFRGKYVHSLISSVKKRYPSFDSKDVKGLLRELKSRIKQAQMDRARSFGMSLKQYDALQEKAKSILCDFHTGHSMGCYKALKVNGGVFCRVYDTHEYANSCRWKATHGSFSIDLNKSQLVRLQFRGGKWFDPKTNMFLTGVGSKSTYKVVWSSDSKN